MDLDGVNGGVGFVTKISGPDGNTQYYMVDQRTGSTIMQGDGYDSLSAACKGLVAYHEGMYHMTPKDVRKRYSSG